MIPPFANIRLIITDIGISEGCNGSEFVIEFNPFCVCTREISYGNAGNGDENNAERIIQMGFYLLWLKNLDKYT